MIRKLLLAMLALTAPVYAQYATLTGNLQASNGLPASNYTISFTPSQIFFVAGTGVAVNTATFCATSVDGSVVGIPNPLQQSVVTPGFSGTLTPGNYYVRYTFYIASSETLPSPETVAQLTSTGQLSVADPIAGLPSGVLGIRVYIGTVSGGESLQGSTVGTSPYVQSVPLVSGASLPTSNNSVCKQIANDAGWPTGTGYNVALSDPSGNTLPGYPMLWQLLGPNTTINLSNGLPYYHGVVTYPVPILASPLNHATQSISGSLNLTGYSLLNTSSIGVGTALPAYPVDVRNGFINSNLGYLVNGTSGTAGQCLASGGASGPDTWINCLTSVASFYQTVASNGTAQTQRPTLNFTPRFTLSDSASPAQTTVDLANSGVTAGSYTSPSSMSVDVFGRVTAIASGIGSPHVVVAVTGTFTTCTMIGHSSTDISCIGTQNWDRTIVGSYLAFCMPYQAGFSGGADSTGMTRAVMGISSMTSTQVTYWTSALQGGATGNTEQAYCQAIQ